MSGIEGNVDDEEEVEVGRSGKPCEGSRMDLIKCLRESECVQVSRVEHLSQLAIYPQQFSPLVVYMYYQMLRHVNCIWVGRNLTPIGEMSDPC